MGLMWIAVFVWVFDCLLQQNAQAVFLARLHAEYDRRKRVERSLAKKKTDLAVSF